MPHVSAPRSLPHNIIWSVMGNGIYLLCQWGTLVAIARLSNPAALGMYGLSLAVTAPIFLFFDLQLRVVYVTDVARSYPLSDYVFVKSLTCCLALGLSILVGFLTTSDSLARHILLAVGLSKVIESADDLIGGLFQKQERLDLFGQLRIGKGVASLFAIAGALAWTRSVPTAILAMGLAWLVIAALAVALWMPSQTGACKFSPSPVSLRRLRHLVYYAFPLGLAMGLVTLQASLPRIALQRFAGFEEVGVYTAISSLLVAGSAVMTAVGIAVVPRMARLFALNRHAEVRRLCTHWAIAAIAVGCVSVFLAWGAGGRLLALLFGHRYSSGSRALIFLMVAMTVTFVASINDFVLVAQRRFRSQVVVHVISTAACLFACAFLVRTYGLTGGALTALLAAVVRLLTNSILLKRSMQCGDDGAAMRPQHRGPQPVLSETRLSSSVLRSWTAAVVDAGLTLTK
jgi:O-antigen/teichoic acid export membrane protein